MITMLEDGWMLIWKIIDEEGKELIRDTKEILFTKYDLEEKGITSVMYD